MLSEGKTQKEIMNYFSSEESHNKINQHIEDLRNKYNFEVIGEISSEEIKNFLKSN
jgi:hypothetical protein